MKENKMIEVGYLAKRIVENPEWLKNHGVEDIYSVSRCISDDFASYTCYWKHNGYWFFDSPEIIISLSLEHNINLDGTQIFFYEAYEYQYYEDNSTWKKLEPDKTFRTNVQSPKKKLLEGYDIVSYSCGTCAECSFLSCNGMAEKIKVNKHCLLETFEEAKKLLEKNVFKGCEPGPSRIIAVYSLSEDKSCTQNTD